MQTVRSKPGNLTRSALEREGADLSFDVSGKRRMCGPWSFRRGVPSYVRARFIPPVTFVSSSRAAQNYPRCDMSVTVQLGLLLAVATALTSIVGFLY